MASYKQSVAYNRHFFMVSSTDHLSAKTGLTPTVNISKAGAAFGAAAGAVSEIANGWYRVALTTADTGSTGDLMFHITSAGADDTDFADQIVSYDPFDAAALGLSRLDAAVTTRMATFTLPTNFSSLSITAAGLVDITQTAADKVWSSATRTLTAFSTALAVSVWDVLDANIATASSVGLRLKGLTFTTANKVDATIQAAGDFAQAAADKVWSSATRTLTAFGFSVTVGTNNDKTGYALSAAGVQAVWDALTSALTTVGSIGKLLVDNINATISSRSTYAGGAVASVTGNVGGNVVGSVGSVAAGGIANTSFAVGAIDAASLATDAGSEIADAVLDRDMSTGTDSGSPTVRTVRQSLRILRNKASIAAGTLTVTKEDDLTSSWTAAVTTSAGNPISTIDPA